MIMRIDEAIQHCLEVAKEQDKLASRYEDASGYSRSHIESLKTNESIKCRECANEHRQLAEWLKELKIYRDGGLKGKWDVKGGGYECNQCGYEFIADDTDDFRFCPWCGAKMGGDVDAIKS